MFVGFFENKAPLLTKEGYGFSRGVVLYYRSVYRNIRDRGLLFMSNYLPPVEDDRHFGHTPYRSCFCLWSNLDSYLNSTLQHGRHFLEHQIELVTNVGISDRTPSGELL